MRRVSHNNTEFTEIFNEFATIIRDKFKPTKLGRYWIDLNYKSQDMNYLYVDLHVAPKGILPIRIDYRYRNKRFRVYWDYPFNPYNFTEEVRKKYINIALKVIEDHTGWTRIEE